MVNPKIKLSPIISPTLPCWCMGESLNKDTCEGKICKFVSKLFAIKDKILEILLKQKIIWKLENYWQKIELLLMFRIERTELVYLISSHS